MLEVRQPGVLTTIQDAGRPGLAHLGVPLGGAVDRVSLRIANLLLGNVPDVAALEITQGGLELTVTEPTVIGLAGADLGARLLPTGRRLLPGASYRAAAGDTLVMPGVDVPRGVRAYISVPDGIDVPIVLGSRSTCLVGRFGGLDGRRLQAGDLLTAQASASRPPPAVWPLGHLRSMGRRLANGVVALRVLPGPHLATLPIDGLARIVERRWTAGADSNRMGLRLHHAAAPVSSLPEVLSHGVIWGAIQLPPDGQPIVLLADHQPTGGYPVVGVVIAADLPVLGQLAAGTQVNFEVVDRQEARRALLGQRDAFSRAEAEFRTAARRRELSARACRPATPAKARTAGR
jgi:biotin-dependent carboxylase-like uncharacterized protein